VVAAAVPALQDVQAATPVVTETILPAAQSEQAEAPEAEYLPAVAQVEHVASPAAA